MFEVATIFQPGIAGTIARASRRARLLSLDVLDHAAPIARRAVDIAIAGAALAVVAPVLAAAAVAIKIDDPGPIMFEQTRIGRYGRPFKMRKLRTMHVDAEARLAALAAKNERAGGVTFKIKKDPRITRVGRILRKLSIDELPQLYNVLEGSMTIFGPRPPLPREVAKYGPRERRRLEVTPGLTCFWQVEGRADLSFEQQVELDLRYIDLSNVGDEIAILAKTIPAVLTGSGAY